MNKNSITDMNIEKLILSLIKDDLINIKLIGSLQKIGLYSDCYYLHLSTTVFELMGFEDNESDKMYDKYIELSEKATDIDITASNKAMEKLADEIYTELKRSKKQM
jgi:hypothetical protein